MISLTEIASKRLHPLLTYVYVPIELIGTGGYGSVLKVQRRSDAHIFAVKLIPRDRLVAHRTIKVKFSGNEEAPGLQNYGDSVVMVPVEAYVLRRVLFDGVVSFVDLFDDESFFYLVQEYHGTAWRGGEKIGNPPVIKSGLTNTPPSSPLFSAFNVRSSSDLYQCIEEHHRLPEDIARYVFAQMVETVQALLEHGIVHCDLKDQNFVVDHKWKVKLIDFGAACLFNPDSFQPPLMTGLVGTRRFAAPEVLSGGWYDPQIADVWSLGIVLSTLLTGDTPFATEDAATSPICAPLPRTKISRDARDLLGRCLEVDTEKRIKVDELRQHPWLAEAYC